MQKNWRHKHKGIRTKKEKESIHYVCQNRNPPFSPLPKLKVLPKSADIANAKSSHYHDGKVPDYLHPDISDIYLSSCHPMITLSLISTTSNCLSLQAIWNEVIRHVQLLDTRICWQEVGIVVEIVFDYQYDRWKGHADT